MPIDNTTENIFRFVQIRPPVPADADTTVTLVETDAVRTLAAAANDGRARRANELLRERVGSAVETTRTTTGRQIVVAANEVVAAGGSVADFVSRMSFDDGGQEIAAEIKPNYFVLSEFLVAAKFATQSIPTETNAIARLLRLFRALLEPQTPGFATARLRDFLRRPLALPNSFAAAITRMDMSVSRSTMPPAGPTTDRPANALDVQLALESIAAAALGPAALASPPIGDDARPILALTASSVAGLSDATRTLVAKAGLDLTKHPLTMVVATLEASLANLIQRGRRPGTVGTRPPVTPPGGTFQRPYLKNCGLAELLVVKQHLVRYDRVDIAHIENVLGGEKKSRTFRQLERIESTTINESETTEERQTELSTAERFEMQKEIAVTVKHDQQFGASLSLSGRYGPAVEFSSNAELDVDESTEQSTRNSSSYAKDVMSRSLERVVERVRDERRLTVLRESEETNVHELVNPTSEPIIGTYQFVEKIYQSQVFNYGRRQMFDFMVPEPASYWWALEQSPATEPDLPEPPPKLASRARDAREINAANYLELAALFGAESVSPPPPVFVTASISLKSADGGDEDGRPRTFLESEVAIPQDYRPLRAVVRPLALTDDYLTLGITVGSAQKIWAPRNAPEIKDVSDSHDLATGVLVFDLADAGHAAPQETLPVQVLMYESHTFGLAVEVIFIRTPQAYEAWQTKTFDAIAKAYDAAQQKYELLVTERRAAAEAAAAAAVSERFGVPPSQTQKTILDELKKHCISILTRQFYDTTASVNDELPPTFDFDAAQTFGAFVRFFEQAFEWDQMQYVCYPYFWAAKATWADRFNRQEIDPTLSEFLRAGSARVVTPVRPGFEAAVTHYLDTGVIWNGSGDPPDVHSPLYVPITTEIRERTGAPNGEVPIGEPWLTHVPTVLAVLRREPNLPQWEKDDASTWEWREKNS